MTEGVTQSCSFLKMTVGAEHFKSDSWHSVLAHRAEMSNFFLIGTFPVLFRRGKHATLQLIYRNVSQIDNFWDFR